MGRRDSDQDLSSLVEDEQLPDDPTEIEVMIEGGEAPAGDSADPEAQLEAEAKAELDEGDGGKGGETTGADDPQSGDTATAADKSGGDTPSGQEAGTEGSPSSDGDPSQPEGEAVVKTRDGKHEIPYSVLQGERERANRLERELQQERERIQQSVDQAQQSDSGTGKSGEDDPAPASVEEAKSDDFDWQAFQDEYGEQATNLLKQQVERSNRLEQEVQELKQQNQREQEARQQQERQQQAETVQQVIDRIPSLAHWQANDSAMFAAAQTLDDKLAEDPQWANASEEDRFREVTRRLGGDAGDGQASGSDTSQQQTSRDRAAAASDSGGKGDDADPNEPGPLSHADIPGGGTPSSPKSTTEEIDESDPVQLEEKLERMSPEERDAYLARL